MVGCNYVIVCNATTTLHSCGYSRSVAVARVHMHASHTTLLFNSTVSACSGLFANAPRILHDSASLYMEQKWLPVCYNSGHFLSILHFILHNTYSSFVTVGHDCERSVVNC